MLGSRFFWKLYASYAVLVLLTTAIIGFLVHGRMERSLFDRLERSMGEGCALLTPYAESAFRGELPREPEVDAVRIGEWTGIRVTLVAADGRVLADSLEDPGRMENHGQRPEVRAALATGHGRAHRHSKTVGTDMLYVGRAVTTDGEVLGTVRLALPLTDVDAQLSLMTGRILFGAAIGCVVALLLGLVVAHRITAPIIEMTEAAEGLRAGRYEARVRRLPRDEIGILGDTLNRMAAEIRRRVATISYDDAQLRAVLAGMVESVIAVDESDRVIFINKAACRLLGVQERDAVGAGIWELIRVADLEELLVEVRASGRSGRRDLVLDRNGQETMQEIYATPLTSSETSGVVIVLHDVTELRRLEGVRRDFVANVSHELKTPLTSIRGYVETLLDGALSDSENNVRFLEKIENHVDRLNHLVSDLLSLGRIEAQQSGLEMKEVDWCALVREAMRRHERDARGKVIDYNLALPLVPIRVLGDVESMTQVIDNLLDNAIKYTPEGGSITISLTTDEEEGVLQVKDNGIGIPAGDLDRIFERFYRVDKARSREVGGTGLGLAIVKHLVGAMKGVVRVESEYGGGSTFTVRLPLA